uniref:Mucin-1 n=1 Tax=Ficedula albicollis TaxID=59894 RepID=A0A803VPU1_FICAL
MGGSTKGNGSTSVQVFPTWITSEGSTAPRETPTQGGPNPSKSTAQPPAAVQLLVRVPLSFRIINRSFNENLRDPASEEYRSLSHTVLSMVSPSPTAEPLAPAGKDPPHLGAFHGSTPSIHSSSSAEGREEKGGVCGEVAVTSMLPSSLNMSLPSPDPFSLPKSTCTCRRKSRGKLDLLSQKDSYHPMAEYLQYQSHGRYVPPNSKPNPYSQVRARAPPLGSRLCGGREQGCIPCVLG